MYEPLGEGAGMFRNKQALQIGCFLGRHLLIFRDGEEDVRFILPPPKEHFITGFLKASPLCPIVCLSIRLTACLPRVLPSEFPSTLSLSLSVSVGGCSTSPSP